MDTSARIIHAVVVAVPEVMPLLNDGTRAAMKAAPGYQGIRATYWLAVYDAVEGYLINGGRVTSYRASMQRAMVQAFGDTVDLAYQEGGGELPLDEETLAWFNGQVSAEMGFIEDLFSRLKAERQDANVEAEAVGRAEGYAGRLDALYSEAMMRGGKNKILYWHLGRTERHCSTCASLDGQGHRISWYIERNYIPRRPYAGMECQGFRCDCTLTDSRGNEYTP